MLHPKRQIPSFKHHRLNRPADHALDIGMGGALEPATVGDFLDVKLVAHTTELHSKQPAELRRGGRLQEQHLFEAPPDGGIEQTLVVGGGNEETPTFIGVEHLEDRVDTATEFPVLGSVLTLLSQGIEFVEEHDHRGLGSELEHLAKIGSGLTEKRGDDAVSTDNGEGPTEFVCDGLRGYRLTAAGRAAEQYALAGAQAVRLQDLLAVVFPKDLFNKGQVARGHHYINQTPYWVAYRKQWYPPFPILWNRLADLPKGRRGGSTSAAIEDGFEVVGEQVMMFLPFLVDNLFRGATKGIQIPFGTRTDELSQQFAVRHDARSFFPASALVNSGDLPARGLRGFLYPIADVFVAILFFPAIEWIPFGYLSAPLSRVAIQVLDLADVDSD